MIPLEQARLRVARDMLTLAERDRDAMQVLIAAGSIDFSVIGFHAQQSVEKALKAVMAVRGITFPRSHDLIELQALFQLTEITCPLPSETLEALNPYAVNSRYNLESDELLNESEAAAAVADCLAWAHQHIN
jgi:HEPN domain-containing protein